MGEGDGVYYSGSAYAGSRSSAGDRRAAARRLKKAAVALIGLTAVGAGAYFGTTLLTGNTPGFVSAGPGVPAPPAPAPSPSSPSPKPALSPSPGPQAGTLNGARQSTRPSPTPSIPDEVVAADQVSRLLAATPQPARPGLSIASGPVTVATETGTDGSTIRVVTARYDLTGRWSPPSTGDPGYAVGDAHCTAKLTALSGGTADERPTMLMCWRLSPGKSVVTVATRPKSHPLAGASVEVLDRNWVALG
jgi:hypothetical protein